MNPPLISVIIPTYNRKEKALRAILSVIDQKRNDIEILVVDDGSTDDTESFLADKNLPITYLYKPNGGVSSARNFGISHARGIYIAFLDSDDTWLLHKLDKQVEYLKEHPEVSLVYTDQYLSDGGKDLEETRFQKQKPKSRMELPAFVDFTPIHTSTVVVKKDVLDAVGYFNETLQLHEDGELWNRVSDYGEFGFIEEPLSRYFWGGNEDHLMSAKNRDKFIESGERYLDLYVQNKKRKLNPAEEEGIRESRKILEGMKQEAVQ